MKIYDMNKAQVLAALTKEEAKPKPRRARVDQLRWAYRSLLEEEQRQNGTLHWRSSAGYTGRNSKK